MFLFTRLLIHAGGKDRLRRSYSRLSNIIKIIKYLS